MVDSTCSAFANPSLALWHILGVMGITPSEVLLATVVQVCPDVLLAAYPQGSWPSVLDPDYFEGDCQLH